MSSSQFEPIPMLSSEPPAATKPPIARAQVALAAPGRTWTV